MTDLGKTPHRLAPVLIVVLAAFSVAGVLHSTRAGIAQCLHRRARSIEAPERRLSFLRLSHALYPHDYYCCERAARAALAAGHAAQSYEESATWREQAEQWCDRGLAVNPRMWELNKMKIDFLWRRAPREAVRHWEAYTDWAFWHPDNHAVLATQYASVGEFEKAERALLLAKGSSMYKRAKRMVAEAKVAFSAGGAGREAGK